MADVVELPWLCVGRMPAAIWKKIAGGRAGPGHGAGRMSRPRGASVFIVTQIVHQRQPSDAVRVKTPIKGFDRGTADLGLRAEVNGRTRNSQKP